MDFYDTVGGRRFVEGTVPKLVRAVERVASALEKANRLKERELELMGAKPESEAEKPGTVPGVTLDGKAVPQDDETGEVASEDGEG